MARLARKRYRMEKKTIFAKAQDLNLPAKYKPQNRVYESNMGMMYSESEDGIDGEPYLLNSCYLSNSVVVENNKDKLVCIKLRKNNQRKVAELNDEVLDEWERRDNPYWTNWVKDYRQKEKCFNKFLIKYKDRFETNKIDEESLKQQEA